MHPVSCTNTHRDVTDLVNHGMVKNTKDWISWERNIISLRNKKILICTSDKTRKLSFYSGGNLYKYETLQGSNNKFQVIVFRSNSDNLRAAPRLCLCKQCKVNYGDCDLFSDFPLSVIELNRENLRHGNNEERNLSSLNN